MREEEGSSRERERGRERSLPGRRPMNVDADREREHREGTLKKKRREGGGEINFAASS